MFSRRLVKLFGFCLLLISLLVWIERNFTEPDKLELSHVESIQNDKNFTASLVRRRRTVLVSVKNLSLLYCPISKNMHSQILALLYRYATGHKYNLNNLLEIAKMWNVYHFSIGVPSKELELVNVTDKIGLEFSNWTKFAIIRDPIDRFISGYMFMCKNWKFCGESHLFHCGDDIFCLLGNLTALLAEDKWPNFGRSILDNLAPQSFYCNFRQQKSAYKLFLYDRSEQFNQNILNFLELQGIPKSLLYGGWGDNNSSAWLSTETQHSTFSKALVKLKEVRKNILSDIVVVNEIYRIYQMDYKLFQLEVPKAYKSQCQLSQFSHLLICQS